MAYLGNAPKGNLLTMNSSQFSGDGSTVNFTLSQTVGNTNEIEVFVGNVRQDPHSAYTVSGGTTLAFTAAPPTGTNNIYVVYIGKSLGEVPPAVAPKSIFSPLAPIVIVPLPCELACTISSTNNLLIILSLTSH